MNARVAAWVVRHLTAYCPNIRATWQVSPDAGPGPVVVFGCARPPAGEYPGGQGTHAFLLTPGEVLPPVWVALCGHQIGHAEFEALEQGMGQPCQGCHQRWAASHQQHSGLPVRSPGEHLHPQLRRPPLTGRPREGGST